MKKFIYIYLGSIGFTYLTVMTRLISSELISSMLGYALFFLFTTIILVNRKSIPLKQVLWAIILGWTSIELTPRFFMGESWMVSISDSFCRLTGIIAAYLFYTIKQPLLKIGTAVAITAATCAIVYYLLLT